MQNESMNKLLANAFLGARFDKSTAWPWGLRSKKRIPD